MTIYPSDKAKAYVYKCTHLITGEFYIGYREANVKCGTPSHLDFPKYKTSSEIVRSEFYNFDWIILAEFNLATDAYDVEQELIWDDWGNPLLLNKNCQLGKKRFRNTKSLGGAAPGANSPEIRAKISSTMKGRPAHNKGIPHSEDARKKISNTAKGKPSPLKGKVGCFKNRKLPIKGLTRNRGPMPEETKRKISMSHLARQNSISVIN